jgi:hypothetical protein
VTVKKLGQAIALPPGSTFNGKDCRGTVEGHTSVPTFTAPVKLFGIVPTTLKLTFAESEELKAALLIPDPNHAGNILFKGTAKENISIGAIGLLGLNIPVSCQTTRPVEFQLESSTPAANIAKGFAFSGQTTLPPVKCSGGLLGSLAGPVISELLSGPNNPFSLTIEP